MNSQFPTRVLPYQQYRNFFGRTAELQQLSNLRDPSNTISTSSRPRTVLIWGLGGVGKSQLALEYAYAYTDRYDAVFWLQCGTEAALERSCSDVVRQLGLAVDPGPSSKEILLFTRWLAYTDRSYLLILDDLDQHSQILSDIWPLKLNNGSIIATSRISDCLGSQLVSALQVLPFDTEEGANFFQFLLDTKDFSPQASPSLELSKRLGGHPLAIAQMVEMIKREKLSIPQFLHLYEKHHRKIDRSQVGLASYSYDLDSVWLLSFKILSHESYQLLGIMSHLAPDSIPATLLCQDRTKVFKFYDAVKELTTSSLIQKDSNSSGIDVFFIHRLVQQVFRDKLSLQERSAAFSDATQLVLNAVQSKSFHDATSSKEIYEILRPHINQLKAFPEARSSDTFTTLLSYAIKPEAGLLDENQSDSSGDTMRDCAFSDIDSVSSQSSVSIEETRSAISLLVEVFRNDFLFVESARQLLSNVKEDKFHRDFGDLLTLFSKDLSADPIWKTQSQSAEWIDSRKHLISQNIMTYLIPSRRDSLTQLSSLQNIDSLILERLGPATDHPAQSSAFSNTRPIANVYYPDNLWDAKDDNNHDFGTWTEHLQNLVSQSSAFEKLKRSLSRINKPYRCKMDGCETNDGFSTLKELEHHKISGHRKSLRVSRTGNISNKLRIMLAFVQALITHLGLILRTSVITAFQGRKRPSPANMVRGQWICACGEVIVDDFHESVPGCVASAMSELTTNQNFKPFTTQILSVESTRKVFSSFNDRIKFLATFVSTITAKLKSSSGGSGNKDRVESREVQEPSELPIANALPPRYLLLCISMWKGYYFTQMLPVDLNVSNDEILFCQLKNSYHRRAGVWKRMLSLRCIKDIRFVRFPITRSKLVDINLHSRMEGRIKETLPPANHNDYTYNPKPIRIEPPVGHNTMIHLYRCPKSSGGLNFCLKRFPGYCQEKVRIKDDADEELAWGIELVEERDWVYIWVIGFLISSFGLDLESGGLLLGRIFPVGLLLLGL